MSDLIEQLSAALSGRYEVEREIGEGGMASVYLARDVRHNRRVALKVLKPELAAVVGAERFLAEIETTANLHHPHILPLFDSGEAEGFLFYVMPFVDGETLRDRIDRERQLPIDEALGIATSVASALQHAHERGVIHRDIKPGNILLQDGQPLVADFGIALAVGAAGGARLTETGLSVGTPYYMSPEQATGDQAVGPASDTFALACVLYEMLVGEPPYPGNTAQAVLGKIIQGAPVSATAIRASIPRNVDAAIRKALEKLPADRFTGAQDFAKALGDAGFRHGAGEAAAAAPTSLWNPLSITASSVAFLSLLALGWVTLAPEPPQPLRGVARFASPFRGDQEPVSLAPNSFTLSPDGSMLVYRGPPSGPMTAPLWVRRWDDLEATPIRDTQVGIQPTVSPDGTAIAFTQAGEVKVLALQGGPVRTLAAGFWPQWGPDGYVYLEGDSGVVRVLATGGPSERVTVPIEGEATHILSDFLPDRRHALVFVPPTDGGTPEIRALDVSTGEMQSLGFGAFPRYAPTGHLTYLVDGTLMGALLDVETLEPGPAVALVEDVGAYALSDNGRLYYAPGSGGAGRSELVWVTRDGLATPVESGWSFSTGGANAGWRISPDGRTIALREETDAGLDIWIKSLDGPRSRLTFFEGEDRKPAWTPDGERVIFLSSRDERRDIWVKRADGTGEAELLFAHEAGVAETNWSPDGEWLIFRSTGVGGQLGGRDIFGIRLGQDGEATPLLTGEYDEISPAVSPDGRWLAYASNETGQHEIFVRPFPDVDAGRWQVSTGGGVTPRWSADGSELFFLDGERRLVAAQIDAGDAVQVVGREVLFEVPATFMVSDIFIPYDVAPDGRFVMGRVYRGEGTEEQVPAAVLVENWFEELVQRVGSR
jgi:serine/threonine protein kinase/Tol biopolymer transport system component